MAYRDSLHEETSLTRNDHSKIGEGDAYKIIFHRRNVRLYGRASQSENWWHRGTRVKETQKDVDQICGVSSYTVTGMVCSKEHVANY